MKELNKQLALAFVAAGIACGLGGIAISSSAEALGGVAIGIAVFAILLSGASLGIAKPKPSTNQTTTETAQESADAVALRHLELLTRGGPKALVDSETSLPDDRYFELALEGRVAAARRHLWPVTLVLLRITLDPTITQDTQVRKDALARFSLLLQSTMRESDVLCRLDGDTFALLLDDTAEEGGVWSAERLQAESSRQHPAITKLVAGVASYPSHGLDAGKILDAARNALRYASLGETGRGLGSVEVARADH